jgi:uncharacterized protein
MYREPSRFCSYELRTTDPDAARTFYEAVIGGDLPPIGPLTERARSLGAPAHWLGHVAVPELEKTVARFLAEGGVELGARARLPDGGELVVLRDPFGSVIAVRPLTETSSGLVGWHQLHTVDHEKAFDFYNACFGWRGVDALAQGDNRWLVFAWDSVHPPAGTIGNSARLSHVHPHWLYYFEVPSLDDALEKAKQRGAELLRGPIRLRTGSRIAVLHDLQRAELGLLEQGSA